MTPEPRHPVRLRGLDGPRRAAVTAALAAMVPAVTHANRPALTDAMLAHAAAVAAALANREGPPRRHTWDEMTPRVASRLLVRMYGAGRFDRIWAMMSEREMA